MARQPPDVKVGPDRNSAAGSLCETAAIDQHVSFAVGL